MYRVRYLEFWIQRIYLWEAERWGRTPWVSQYSHSNVHSGGRKLMYTVSHDSSFRSMSKLVRQAVIPDTFPLNRAWQAAQVWKL
jgi:hypothetical protein